jgi:hypothetical protein
MEKKKPLEVSLREHIGKLIDNSDPLEIGAVIGLTIIVKLTIDKTEEIRGWLATTGGLYTEFETIIGKQTLLTWLGNALGLKPVETEKYEGMFPDWADWIISFAIAYIIVRHGGAIFGLLKGGAGNLITVIKSLIGMSIT